MAQTTTTTQQRAVFLIAILVFYLAVQGESQQCGASSIDIQQTNTGRKVGSLDTVFQVAVTNRCRCAVKAIFLRADGFTSTIAVDPKLFRRAAAGYLVGNGQRVPSGTSVTFQYAWDHYFKMTPSSVQAQC